MFAALFQVAGAAPIIVVEPAERRRAIALECGASVALSPEEFEQSREQRLPFGADVVVDAVGSLFRSALGSVATGGRVVLIGMNANARDEIVQNEITQRGLSVLGSYITNFTFPTAIRLLERGVPDLSPIITHHLALEDVHHGLELLRSGDALKVVIELNGAAPG
jgi:threonine dehydrogenase-like Zn-dependent dehydrogenase